MKSPLLFVALDDLGNKERETLEVVRELDQVPGNFGYKINLDCLIAEGVRTTICKLPASRPIFADTKTWNGKRTMTDIAKMLVDAGVDYFNVWGQADDQLAGAVQATEGSKTKILGDNALTHYNDDRHKQEVTPEFATQNGADIVVCGSPIMKVSDKGGALRQILSRLTISS